MKNRIDIIGNKGIFIEVIAIRYSLSAINCYSMKNSEQLTANSEQFFAFCLFPIMSII